MRIGEPKPRRGIPAIENVIARRSHRDMERNSQFGWYGGSRCLLCLGSSVGPYKHVAYNKATAYSDAQWLDVCRLWRGGLSCLLSDSFHRFGNRCLT